jgi:hypothetical protein
MPTNSVKDLSKYLNRPELHPENLIPLLVLLGQGEFILENILPVVPSTDDFTWMTEISNDKFNTARKRGERGTAAINDFLTQKLTDSTQEYFEQAQITAKQMRSGNVYAFINLIAKKMDTVAGKIRMNSEKDGIAELVNTTKYTTINTHSASVAWSTYASSDPIKEIELAKNVIRLDEFTEATDIILGATNKTEMTLSDSIRDSKQYTVDYTANGIKIARIADLQVHVATAVYKSGTSYVPILDSQGIIMVRGCAEIRESDPYNSESVYDPEIKILKLLASRSFKTIVTRPQQICLLNSI